MKKKLLVLGSDFGAEDVVVEAQKMGLHVIHSDNMESSPAKSKADEKWYISTTDYDELEKQCRLAHVDGVTIGTTDVNGDRARILCKRLGLPFYCNRDEAWNFARNKSIFKDLCEKVGAPTAKRYYLTDDLKREDLDKIVYPVVVKPVDLSANRGVSFCHNEEELIAGYHEARRESCNPTIVVEKMLHGQEYVVNYVLTNGKARLLYFGSQLNQPGHPSNYYSMVLTSAHNLKKWNEEANDKVIKLLEAAGYENGIAWVQAILDEDGHFYIIEPAYRFSSETSYQFYERVCGFNSLKWYIEDAMGVKHAESDLPESLNCAYESCVASYHLFTNEGGIIHSIEGLKELEALDNVTVDLPRREGMPVATRGIMGVIRIYGKTIDEAVETLKYVNKVFSCKNEKGENLFVRYTDYEGMKAEFVAGLKEFSN